ncbi:hypothetical protein [Methylophilus aquaticus]|uniref:Lipoprotein n=1 Tax=Methylophilus aquaticus TaxID=1971610 RepID=A0ABT9JW23_9PROT|nr:hypothetical protein [Methylophilus aquaticus]MDP8568773.1 hypothetical protein [Methylophilus aquaticus]
MRFLTYLILAGLLASCGELSYKQGGSPQDIERAHRACRGSGDELNACLAEHGWQKPQADQFDPLFATVSVTDNRQDQAGKPSPIIEIAPKPVPKTSPAAVVKTPQQPAATPDLPAQSELATTPPAHSTLNDGPDVEYAINSWWKMGAFPDKLKQDQRSCEKKLGQDYLPDYKTQTYKRAFVVCMHDLGWMAVRNIK